MTILSSCAVTYIRDYRKQMRIIEDNFPEIYDLYCNGDIIINNVYIVKKKDGTETYHVNYHYR